MIHNRYSVPTRKLRQRRTTGAVAAMLLAATGMYSGWAGYKAEGGFVYRNFISASEEHFRFQVQVGKSGWLITTRRDGVFRQFGHHEVGCDGTNLFRVLYLNAEPYARARARTNYAFVNGWVTPGTVPEADPSHARFVWFALVALPSGKWSNSVPCGLLYHGLSPTCTLPARVLERDESGKGVKTMLVLNPGFMYGFDGKPHPLGPPYDQGYTQFEYRAHATRIVDGFCIPLSCVLRDFIHKAVGGVDPKDLDPVCSVELRVESVASISDRIPVVPQIEDAALIFDSRRSDPKEVSEGYLSFRGWIDPSVPVEEARGLQKRAPRGSPVVRYMVLVAMALISAGAIWAWIARRYNVNHATERART